MAEIKLIVSDLDDTLINDDFEMTGENIKAIKKAQEKGVQFTIATGRMFCSALPYALELGINLPLITYQGALIKEISTNSVLNHQTIPLTIAKEIARETEGIGYHLNAYINDELLVKEETPEGRYYQKIARTPLKIIGSLAANLTGAPTKLLVIAAEENLIPLMTKWAGQFGQELYLTRSKPNFLEIMVKGADKGNGVKLVADRLGIAKEEIMVIGDSYNDLEMFAYSGISVAMGNARREIQAKADFVTASNEDNGVAEAIKRFVL